MNEDLLKKIVKFYVLRYVITKIVARTVIGKHKEAYIEPGLEPIVEAVVDALWDNRGRHMAIDMIKYEVALRSGFIPERKKEGVAIYIKPKGAKKSRKVEDAGDSKGKFTRVIMYALGAIRDVFGIVKLVKRPARDAPEWYIEDDWLEAISNRFNKVVERINARVLPNVEDEGAFVCPNMHCDVLELYTSNEAEENEYRCKGKVVPIIEYGESSELGMHKLTGCGSYLEEIDPEILRNVVRILNTLIEKISD